MHNPTEQDVLDLISAPSTHVDTSSWIISTYLNPEFQYNLQLTNLTNCLNTASTASIDWFWSTTQQSLPKNTGQILSSDTVPPQLPSDSGFPSHGPNPTALSQQDMNINSQQYPQQPNHYDQSQQQILSGPVYSVQSPNTVATALKYHRSMSQLYQPSDYQHSVSPPSTFNHRASLPNIYPVNNKTNKHPKNHTIMDDKTGSKCNDLVQNTMDVAINTSNNSNGNYGNAIPLLTWNQSLGHSYQHLRPTSTLDDSTRKRTKSMDNMNDKSAKMDEQQQYHCYQTYSSLQPQYKRTQQEQEEYQYLQQRQQQNQQKQQQLNYNARNITITLDQNSINPYTEDRTINTLNPPYHQQYSSPTIKSPMSAVSSLSTISSTNTMKHPDDEVFDKEEKHHRGEDMGDPVGNMIKKGNGNVDDYNLDDIKNGIPCNDELNDHYTCQTPGNIDSTMLSAGALHSLHVESRNDTVPHMDSALASTNPHTSTPTMSSTSAQSSSSPSSSSTSSSSHSEFIYPVLSEADMDAATRDTSAMPRRQNPRYDTDAYTPRWVRYTGQQKQGYCESCQPMGKWLQLKNSAYWYHKQFFHGISSVSGQPFSSPLEQRLNKESDLLEGLCHQCLQFVPICNTKRKNSVLWYRHAHKVKTSLTITLTYTTDLFHFL
ncbi:unnamed protein product [Absidia cylindrospora]